jgi:hypothetical protein
LPLQMRSILTGSGGGVPSWRTTLPLRTIGRGMLGVVVLFAGVSRFGLLFGPVGVGAGITRRRPGGSRGRFLGIDTYARGKKSATGY